MEYEIFVKIFISFLTILGAKSLIVYFYDNFKSLILILQTILSEYFQPETFRSIKERYGDWAVITGATDGIGKAYALELAKQKINIILISRSREKLIETAMEIESNYLVKTKWIIADFSEDKTIYEHIKRELTGYKIGILVNNVGQMYDYPQEFDNVPDDKIWNMISLNVGATVMMTKLLIDHIKTNGRGAIVNIGSICQNMPGPLFAVYAASKAFVKYFTIALQWELESYENITVQLLNPAFIATKLTNFSDNLKEENLLVANVKSFVKSAVFTLGRSDETSGTISHGIQFAISDLVSERIRTFFANKIARYWNRKYLQDHNIVSS